MAEVKNNEVLKGAVKRITYLNEQNGYTVASVLSNGEEITVVGNMPFIRNGDDIEAVGSYIVHSVYGRQFKADMVEKTMPTDTAALLRYLSAGNIKGIGPSTARKIVETFGEDTMMILESSPEELSRIKGISLEKARAIGEEYTKLFGIRDLILLLSKFKISSEDAIKIYSVLGTASISKIETNPYVICDERIDLPFEKAEDIAQYYKIPANDSLRLSAGVEYVLRKNTYNGHTCLPRNKLCFVTANLLETEEALVDKAIETLLSSLKVRSTYINDIEYIALPEYYTAEEYIAARLTIMNREKKVSFVDEREISLIEQQMGIILDEKQRLAITDAFENGMLILTGGPGTGKTTTLKAMIEMFKRRNMNTFLAAPTGRAAKRMTELTGYDAKTIHRLLEAEWSETDGQVFCKNENNTLDCDVIIVDEVSMIDTRLFENLLRALRLSCRIVLVGDYDQLPSVSAGNVLSDLISSDVFRVIKLDKIFRQAEKSAIITNAHKIVEGKPADLNVKDSDFFFIKKNSAEAAMETVVSLCSERLPSAYGFDSVKDIQVLCPSRKMPLGTLSLNNLLQTALNPKNKNEPEIFFKGFYLRSGDKVMQIKNNYDLEWIKDDGEEGTGVFNGDVGFVKKVNLREGTVTVRYDDKTVVYTVEELSQIELAFAITVHKSQGSEFDCVVIPLYDIPGRLKYRNLLYTAVTRAKKLLIIVGKETVFYEMAANDKKTLRYTLLKDFIKEINECEN